MSRKHVAALAIGLSLSAGPRVQVPAGIVGTWQLVSRVDRDSSGRVVPEPSLGSSPTGYLIYDATGHVAAQMMASNRTGNTCAVTAQAAPNNLAHINGYDAYFGRYDIDAARGIVYHHLDGALPQADVGRTIERHFALTRDTLTITFRPGGAGGVLRTLIWHRAG